MEDRRRTMDEIDEVDGMDGIAIIEGEGKGKTPLRLDGKERQGFDCSRSACQLPELSGRIKVVIIRFGFFHSRFTIFNKYR